MTTIPLDPAPHAPAWRAAQWAGLVLITVLLAALMMFPDATLNVLWNMVIPLLPAVFLVNPVIWRNVCPLATINTLSSKLAGSRRQMGSRIARVAWVAGTVLLAVMVPARRFLFNTNGAAMAATIILVAALAIAGGIVFARRGGFCNAICPVLPVEKLYGQAPLLRTGTARCASCSACTPVGCLELAAAKTVPQTVGKSRRDMHWITSSFGAFAAAFPGFVIGYFYTADGTLSTAPMVYGRVLGFAALSYMLFAWVVVALRITAARALPMLGILSFGLYYWYAAEGLGTAYGAPESGPWVVRGVALALVVFWLAGHRRRITAPIVRPARARVAA
jgi:hypothetical protein